eukprot:11966037-Ditylum_brightwellii.AAC.1
MGWWYIETVHREDIGQRVFPSALFDMTSLNFHDLCKGLGNAVAYLPCRKLLQSILCSQPQIHQLQL